MKDPARVAPGQGLGTIRQIMLVERSILVAAALVARLVFAVGRLAATTLALRITPHLWWWPWAWFRFGRGAIEGHVFLLPFAWLTPPQPK